MADIPQWGDGGFSFDSGVTFVRKYKSIQKIIGLRARLNILKNVEFHLFQRRRSHYVKRDKLLLAMIKAHRKFNVILNLQKLVNLYKPRRRSKGYRRTRQKGNSNHNWLHEVSMDADKWQLTETERVTRGQWDLFESRRFSPYPPPHDDYQDLRRPLFPIVDDSHYPPPLGNHQDEHRPPFPEESDNYYGAPLHDQPEWQGPPFPEDSDYCYDPPLPFWNRPFDYSHYELQIEDVKAHCYRPFRFDPELYESEMPPLPRYKRKFHNFDEWLD